MVGNQLHDQAINTYTMEIPRPVQRMETCLNQLRGVTNVM